MTKIFIKQQVFIKFFLNCCFQTIFRPKTAGLAFPATFIRMKYLPLNPLIFKQNRLRFLKEMQPDSIAIFVSNDEIPSNGDAIYPFKQNSDLYWLTGIVQEDTMLVLFPDHPDPKYREVLILVTTQ